MFSNVFLLNDGVALGACDILRFAFPSVLSSQKDLLQFIKHLFLCLRAEFDHQDIMVPLMANVVRAAEGDLDNLRARVEDFITSTVC